MIGKHRSIRSVDIYIYYGGCVSGFAFFDENKFLLFEIGDTSVLGGKTVVLGCEEVIVGVVAKLAYGFQSVYSDF